MRVFGTGIIILTLLLPTAAFAAGFAKDPLFLSKSPVTEGDSVRIYTIVANPASAAFTGTLALNDGPTSVGSAKISIDAGGTQTASVAWKPAAGSHTISATLTDSSGTVVEAEQSTFVINAKPKPVSTPVPTSTNSATVDSSQGIQNGIGSVSPQAQQITQPFFAAIDSLRGNAATLIDNQLSGAKSHLSNTHQGEVEGASTGPLANPAGSFWFILWTLYLYLLTILSWLVSNAGIFYPFFAIVFFYMLWRIFRRMRRPSY